MHDPPSRSKLDYASAPEPNAGEQFERRVVAQVLGTLIAWLVGLLVYLMYRLWQVNGAYALITPCIHTR